MRFHLLHIVLILILPFGFRVDAQQYNFQKYSIEDGLPRSSVYALCQDSDGFLWIGLDGGGVSMFDGKTFTNFDISSGIPSHNVRDVFQDSQGNMWFGTDEGLCKYNFDSIIVYRTEDGICNNYIRTLAEDDKGNIWIGTNDGISIFDGKTFKNYNIQEGLLDHKIRIIFKDHTGKMFIGTDSGINFFNGKYFEDFIYNYYLPHPTTLEIFEDHDNYLWIGTNEGILKIKGDDFKIYTDSDGLITNRIRAISEDEYHNMWFGTRLGVSKFDGTNFTTFNQSNGLSHDRIRDILLDSRGNLWFATYFGGIDRYSGHDFISYTTDEGLISNQVYSIFEDADNHIILGTFDGVSKVHFKNGIIDEIKNITHEDGLSNNRVYDVLKDEHGYYWYGTQNGITISNNGKNYYINKDHGLVHNQVTKLYHADSNVYWIGTESGISKISFTNFPFVYTIKNFENSETLKLAGEQISSIHRDEFRNLWFGFRNGTISVLDSNEKLINPKLPNSLKNVTALTKGKNKEIWVGTDANGLFRIENNNNFSDPLNIINYSTNDDLQSNHIYAILVDNYYNVWTGSERGLDNLIFDENKILQHINHYSTKEGLKGIEITENAAFLDHDNNLWFGTIEGVSFLNTSLVKDKMPAPKVFISSIKIFGNKIEKSNSYGMSLEGRFMLPEELLLPFNKNSIQIEMIPLELRSSEKIQLKWMLEGFDKDWQAPTDRRFANYTNLPPGKYTFKVLSSNENGDWAETPELIRINITPPFWQTTWFISIALIIGIFIFFSISQWRVRRLKKAKQELEHKIDIATAELRKEKELIEVQNILIEKHKDQLTEINTSLTDSINYAKRIQKAIMNPNDTNTALIKDRTFIFHRPKDIVSGDFFWLRDFGSSSYITAADCTGHGVPGAFMSMIGITYLNQILDTSDNHPMPDKILFELRKSIINALRHEGDDKSKDGMDMGLCRIDWENNKVYFSGANNSMYHVRNGELNEIKANKMPIGDHDLKDKEFDLNELHLQEGDMLYLYSDGYADQFGGVKGKKYKYKPFKFFLESIYDFPLEKQKEALKDELDRWIGDYEQIDDILVIGVKI